MRKRLAISRLLRSDPAADENAGSCGLAEIVHHAAAKLAAEKPISLHQNLIVRYDPTKLRFNEGAP